MRNGRRASEAAFDFPGDGLGGEIDADEFLVARGNGYGFVDQEDTPIHSSGGAVHVIARPIPAEIEGPKIGPCALVVAAKLATHVRVEATVVQRGGPLIKLIKSGVEEQLCACAWIEAIQTAVSSSVHKSSRAVDRGCIIVLPLSTEG